MRAEIDIEWARVAPDKVVVATGDRAWLHRPGSEETDAAFAQPMVGAGSIATTRKLLDGAIAAAKSAVSSCFRPLAFTNARWVWQLVGAYHLTHSYPPLIEEAARRFEKMGRQDLSQWAAQKAREERGHDQLALLDIKSMGYKAEAVVEALTIPPKAVAIVNYLTQSVHAIDPIGCVGYSYVMERIATGIKEKHIQSLEALLPPGIRATRCLRTHSSVGADVEHLEGTFQMITGLVPEERTRVATTSYETALLYFNSDEDYISEEELQRVLKPLESRTYLQARVDIPSLTR
ncbi:hypothetical protein ICL16_26515 [Iningainema sp. BLCCT55]|uniref:Uncharacterized protein n=1 Tax=Iningainema tapete BLCC-T55 TaxID=2748662 RepID=A0A8J7C943_9CYAN|nr:hypothetical protein [Iningainema tapete]MBD2775516.1 hypothetical protein [Iningainema tapete BLCC-T55]